MNMALFWLWLGLVFFAGLFLGVLLTRFGAKPTWHKALEAQALEEKLKLQTQEMQQLKDQVGDHFAETASLVNKLTRSYKDVYDHLEKGAYDLVGEEALHKRLEDVVEEPILLEYLGQKRSLAQVSTKPTSAALASNVETDVPARPIFKD